MPILCAVYGCVKKSNDKSLSFYRFPKVKNNVCSDLKSKMLAQRTAWLTSLKRSDVLDSQLNSMRICSIHFKGGKPAKYYDEKNLDWIPTIKMGYNTNTSKASTPKLERYHRANKRLKLKPTSLFNDDPTSVVGPVDPHNNINIEEPIVIISDNQYIDNIETGTSCNTDLKMADIKEFLQLKTKFTKLQNELNYYNLSEKSFDGREKMFTYYTGLESIAVFNLILDYI